MARDTGRRGHGESDPEPSPVDQLETWRSWRHDTAEFPAVPAQGDDEWLRAADVHGAAPDQGTGQRRRRPGTGLLVGAALLLAALVVSGLAAAGVGPVAHLLGSSGDTNTPSGTSGSTSPTSSSSTPSSSTNGTSSDGTSSDGTSSDGTSSDGTSSDGTSETTAPSAAPAPNGSEPTGAAPGAAGDAGSGAQNGRPDPANGPGGTHATPPQPPVGGPGA